MSAPLPAGPHRFYLDCPACKQGMIATADISARLTVAAGKTGELRVICQAKPVPHDCNGLVLDAALPGMTGEADDED